MNYAAYGLGQGLANSQNGNSLINAMNTASLIQFRRDQQRLQNRYADIAQQNVDLAVEKWNMESQLKQQELEQKIFELEQKQLKVSGQNFVNVTAGAIDAQDPTAMNNLIQQDSNLKKLADTAGVIGFSFFNQYSDEELRKLGVAEGMNPREYMITLNSDGTKRVINARTLMATLGAGNLFSQVQLDNLFRSQQMLNMQNIANLANTEEGVEQAKLIASKNNQIERVYNPAVDAEGKASVVKPTAFEQKQALSNEIQENLTRLPSIENQEEFNTTALRIMNEGSDAQKLTAAQTFINRELDKGIPLNELANTQIGAQSFNVLYSSLSKTEQTQYQKLTELLRNNAKISASITDLSKPGTLDEFVEDRTIAKADTWLTKMLNTVNPQIKQDLTAKGFKNDEVRQKYQNVLNTMIKAISGSAVSNQEAERLRMELGDIVNEAGVGAIIGLKTLATNIFNELKVYDTSPTMKIFVKPQLQQFQAIMDNFDEIGRKFGLSTSQPSEQVKARQTANRESVKKQVFDMIPSAK